MNDQEINQSIAKFVGWERFSTQTVNGELVQYGFQKNSNQRFESPIPNFCTDLNAIHEAEKHLSIDQEYSYGEELRRISENVGPKGGHFTPNGWGCFSLAHLSAKQKAEAFVKIINHETSK
jgi:hypothetical protein